MDGAAQYSKGYEDAKSGAPRADGGTAYNQGYEYRCAQSKERSIVDKWIVQNTTETYTPSLEDAYRKINGR